MNSCEYYQELISRLVDGEVNRDEYADLMAHMKDCSRCNAMYAVFHDLSEILAEEENEELPEGLHENIMAGVRRSAIEKQNRRRRSHLVRNVLTAAACAALVLFAARGLNPSDRAQEVAIRSAEDVEAPARAAAAEEENEIAAAEPAPGAEVKATPEVHAAETDTPAETLRPVRTPDPTPSAEPTPDAAPAAKPTETAKPAQTAKPTATAKPMATAKPAQTVKPTATAAPTATPVPTASAVPAAGEKPAETTAPAQTAELETSAAPTAAETAAADSAAPAAASAADTEEAPAPAEKAPAANNAAAEPEGQAAESDVTAAPAATAQPEATEKPRASLKSMRPRLGLNAAPPEEAPAEAEQTDTADSAEPETSAEPAVTETPDETPSRGMHVYGDENREKFLALLGGTEQSLPESKADRMILVTCVPDDPYAAEETVTIYVYGEELYYEWDGMPARRADCSLAELEEFAALMRAAEIASPQPSEEP